MNTCMSQCIGKGSDKEIVVFEYAQKTKIHDNTQPKPELFRFFIQSIRHFQTCEIIQPGRKYQQKQKTPVPATIKIVTGNQQQDILKLVFATGNKPVKQKYNR